MKRSIENVYLTSAIDDASGRYSFLISSIILKLFPFPFVPSSNLNFPFK